VPIWENLGMPQLATHMLMVGTGITGALVGEAATANGLSVILLDRHPPFHDSTAASTALLQLTGSGREGGPPRTARNK
jgi:glycerol-3-phosphate dehydrogenase